MFNLNPITNWFPQFRNPFVSVRVKWLFHHSY